MFDRDQTLMLRMLAVLLVAAIVLIVLVDPGWWSVPFVAGSALVGGGLYWLYRDSR